MSNSRKSLLLPILLIGACCAAGCAPQTRSWPYDMELGGVPIHVEVARTDAERSRGLMYREKLGQDWGMLFVYPRAERLSFYMRNTKIPLSIAFLDDGRVVRDIQDMTPFDETLHVSKAPARYALEMEQGWFARRNVAPGSVAKFSPELEAFLAGK
jgi:uncharacterized membrane protein (UPF0127 family)